MFITLEGIEGCGKSTQADLLAGYLEKSLGREVVRTRQPGGSSLGAELRRILLNPANSNLDVLSELFLYLADRAQHVSSLIRPALERGGIVVCDRYADSTVVYQGYGRGLDPKLLQGLNEVAVSGLWPDLTLLLDLAPEVGLKRALTRNLKENKASSEGRFEAESLAFHGRVREGYLTWAALHQDRFQIIEAAGHVDEVFEKIRSVLEAWMAGRGVS
ncbi:MAG: dTMP kinase [Deltaproteobacteria bacterium]|nr:dTMP kinase [Deltaproteobacteria bacterium]